MISPLARASAAKRQVLLLDELLNWKHALASLVRLRSYASELGFEVPLSEEQRIWGIFDAQPPEMRRGMLERFRASARFDTRVAEEAAARTRAGSPRPRRADRAAHARPSADVKVLPLRMTAAEVKTLDEAWRRLGFKSRTAMLKKAIGALLEAGCAT